MNKSIINKLQIFLCFFIVGHMFSQEKLSKLSQSINVDKAVKVNLNTSYTNIIIDTWNKDIVEIEAYIESERLSQAELKEALKDWNVDVDATTNEVTISTKGHAPHVWAYKLSTNDDEALHAVLEELKFELAEIPNFVVIPDIPEIPAIPKLPELPPLPEGIGKVHFDYEAYKKDGENYLKEYTKQFEKTFGKDYEKKMEEWGEKFEKEWGEKYAEQMEAWGDQLALKIEHEVSKSDLSEERQAIIEERLQHRIEERNRRLEKQMKEREKHMQEREKHMQERQKEMEKREHLAEERRVVIEKMISDKKVSDVKKTIIIKLPKKAKLKVNVRHGEIEFASTINDLNANLEYTKFKANSINGNHISINASYSPVTVSNWELGDLNLNYVKKATIGTVNHLVVNSNSSNVIIENLEGNAIINGSIGDLKILNIGNEFSNLNVVLQNSDATIVLPKVAYKLQYTGNHSRFSHPEKEDKNNVSTFSTGSLSSGKNIIVNAKYSTIDMK
ncbi:DUF4097 family beta strand repeat-containing protein [Aestuariibaculum sediminum]|uniref:Adhesin domain-containing protein n=1 Tax=Aestuariibaculum sediminum TaxID=2770637 RepID=A0A8J6Q9Q5_9FLAO|nr:hypothetical protein [Aestuariibaculum sediminum]MBD0832692.1 hypothetical protein [Aestuariibaculum sediminum]